MKKYFMVKETYIRTEVGKKWGKQPAEVERIEVDEEYYNNIKGWNNEYYLPFKKRYCFKNGC